MQESTVINGIWGYLFSQGRTEKIRYVEGQKLSIGFSRQDVERMVRSFLSPSVQRITKAYDWNFACTVTTDAFVAGTSEYTLRGNDEDCQDIINIRWGDNLCSRLSMA